MQFGHFFHPVERLAMLVPSRRSALRLIAGIGLASAAARPGRTQTPPIPVRLGYVPVIGASSVFVLDGAGWAKQAGFDLKSVKFESGPNAIQAFISGTLDLLAIGVAPVAVARAKGLDVSVVAAAATGGSSFIASAVLADLLKQTNGDRARAFADFRAKQGRPAKLATLPPGGVPTVALNYWLWKTGKVDRADVDIITMGIDVIQQAMLAGTVDGATVLEPSASIVLARNPRLEAIATVNDMFPQIPGVVIAASGNFKRAHPDAVVTLVKLAIRATDMLKNDPRAAAPYVQTALGGGLVDEAIMVTALTSPAIGFVVDPHAIIDPTGALLAYEVELGDFASAPPTSELFDTSFFDRAATADGAAH
jgi:NitT/TauT family transport system substrate-binding protein